MANSSWEGGRGEAEGRRRLQLGGAARQTATHCRKMCGAMHLQPHLYEPQPEVWVSTLVAACHGHRCLRGAAGDDGGAASIGGGGESRRRDSRDAQTIAADVGDSLNNHDRLTEGLGVRAVADLLQGELLRSCECLSVR